jgi:hypothetical protein
MFAVKSSKTLLLTTKNTIFKKSIFNKIKNIFIFFINFGKNLSYANRLIKLSMVSDKVKLQNLLRLLYLEEDELENESLSKASDRLIDYFKILSDIHQRQQKLQTNFNVI